MDRSEINETSNLYRKCFKLCSLGPLKIIHTTNSYVLFWNSYQIFAYENMSFQQPPKVFVPAMQIQQLTSSNNSIICLDKCGNIHTTPLKFRNATKDTIKILFLPRTQNVLAIYRSMENNLFTIVKEGNELYLCSHKDNLELQIIQRHIIFHEDLNLANLMLDNIIFKCYKISKDCYEFLKDVFKTETFLGDCTINFISFDRQTIYCCITSLKTTNEQTKLVKLYTCPSKICDIEIDDKTFSIIIGLSVGTILKIALQNIPPVTIHLNIALHKFEYANDILICTDGNSMWKAEGTFSPDKKFIKLFPSSVKDFIKCKNHIVATTYCNLIYIFADNESVYLNDHEINGYSAADTILNNNCIIDAIFEQVEINKRIIKKLEQEKNMLTILSLANREDIISKMVNTNILVYDNYQDVLDEHNNIVLMENIEEYFKKDSMLFAIKIDAAELLQQFDKIFTELKSIKVHVSIDCCGRIIKTGCFNVKLLPKSFIILVPVDAGTLSNEIKVHLRLTTVLPGVHDIKTKTWIVLYKKTFLLGSEYFIKVNTYPKVISQENLNFDDLLTKTTNNYFGNIFKVNDIQNHNQYSAFVHLPQNFEKVFNEKDIFIEELGVKQASYLSQRFKCNDFLRSKINIQLQVLQKIVTLEIFQEDFTNNFKLKITSVDIETVHNLRNFFSSVIHDRTKNINTEFGIVSSKLYTTVENLQKRLRDCVRNSETDNLKPLIEEFNKNIFGALII